MGRSWKPGQGHNAEGSSKSGTGWKERRHQEDWKVPGLVTGQHPSLLKMGDASWEKAEVCFSISSITFGKLVELFFFFWIILGFRNSNRFMKQIYDFCISH